MPGYNSIAYRFKWVGTYMVYLDYLFTCNNCYAYMFGVTLILAIDQKMKNDKLRRDMQLEWKVHHDLYT